MKKKVIVGICIVIVALACPLAIKIYKQNTSDVREGGIHTPIPLDKQIVDNIKKEYPEWMGALDVKDEKIIGYEGPCWYSVGPDRINQRALNIYDPKGDYIKDIVEKDSNYFKKNKGSDDLNSKRRIYYGHATTKSPYQEGYGYKNFLNQACDKLGLDIEIDGFMKIGYILGYSLKDEPIIDNIEVLEIYNNENNYERDAKYISDYCSNNKINGLRYIVLLDFEKGADKKLEEEIKSTYPDVKIYQVNTKDEKKE